MIGLRAESPRRYGARTCRDAEYSTKAFGFRLLQTSVRLGSSDFLFRR